MANYVVFDFVCKLLRASFLALWILTLNSNPSNKTELFALIHTNNNKKVPKEPYSLLKLSRYIMKYPKPRERETISNVVIVAPGVKVRHLSLSLLPK